MMENARRLDCSSLAFALIDRSRDTDRYDKGTFHVNASSRVKVLLAFEKAFIEAGERAARLAAKRAAELGLTVPYSDGVNLVEVLPDGTVRTVKPLEAVGIGNREGKRMSLPPAGEGGLANQEDPASLSFPPTSREDFPPFTKWK